MAKIQLRSVSIHRFSQNLADFHRFGVLTFRENSQWPKSNRHNAEISKSNRATFAAEEELGKNRFLENLFEGLKKQDAEASCRTVMEKIN